MGKRVVVVMAALAILAALVGGHETHKVENPAQRCSRILAPGESC